MKNLIPGNAARFAPLLGIFAGAAARNAAEQEQTITHGRKLGLSESFVDATIATHRLRAVVTPKPFSWDAVRADLLVQSQPYER